MHKPKKKHPGETPAEHTKHSDEIQKLYDDVERKTKGAADDEHKEPEDDEKDEEE